MNERTFRRCSASSQPTTSHPRPHWEGSVMEMNFSETVCCRDVQQSHRADMSWFYPTPTHCCESLCEGSDSAAVTSLKWPNHTESCLSVTVPKTRFHFTTRKRNNCRRGNQFINESGQSSINELFLCWQWTKWCLMLKELLTLTNPQIIFTEPFSLLAPSF